LNNCFRTETYYDFAGLQKKLFWQSKKKKQFHKLIRLVANERNLLLAHRNIKSNKGSKTPAVSKTTVETVKAMETQEYLTLMKLLLLDYNVRWTRRIYIPKRDSEELRPIGIPDYIDRDLEQVIRQVIEPIAEAKFYPFSYGFRPGRGTQQAIQKCREITNFGYFFALEFDIQKFFDNVDFKILVKTITEDIGIKDKQLIAIIKKRLKGPILDKRYQKVIYPEIGTPQGSLCKALHNFPYAKETIMQSNQRKPCLSKIYFPFTLHNIQSHFKHEKQEVTFIYTLVTLCTTKNNDKFL